MTTSNATAGGSSGQKEKSASARQLDAIAWALFLIWIGVAVLANVGWGWALLGMSVIILGTQSVLWRRAETIDVFSVACGLVFLVGGAWVVLGLTWPLAPVLLILLGMGLLWSAVFGARAQ
jgi:hypothetical protein